MLEAIRRFGVERRWVFGIILGLVTVAFVGTMGWMGMSGPSGAYAAKAGGQVVLLSEFEQAYKNAYRDYERRLGDQFSPELMEAIQLKMMVLTSLIDRKLWLNEARHLGLVASDAEVRDALMGFGAFQVGGRFNSRVYLEMLNRMHTTPEAFEGTLRDDILVDKAQSVVASAAQLTPADLARPAPAGESAPPTDDAARAEALDRKRAQVVSAYTSYLHGQAKVRVYRENLGL